jgi:hypothetical protein
MFPEMPHSKQDAQEILDPHMAKLSEIFPAAWDRWEEFGETAPELRLEVCSRTRSSMLSNFATNAAVKIFGGMGPEVVLTDQPGFLLMIFQSKLYVRLKKYRGGGSYQTHSIPTDQQKLYDAQQPLPGFPEASNCVHGYVLKADNSYYRETTIRCSTGKRLHWTINVPLLEQPGTVEQLPASGGDIVPPDLNSTIKEDKAEEGGIGG